ncbi:MAG: hypothetical protein QM791_21075 [Ferruginibacter sp.]
MVLLSCEDHNPSGTAKKTAVSEEAPGQKSIDADSIHVQLMRVKYESKFGHHFNYLSGDEIKAIIYWSQNICFLNP